MVTDRLHFRRATRNDLEGLVAMLVDDRLGATRDDATQPLDARYAAAFQAIDTDPNQCLVVAELAGALVGMAQLTFILGLSNRGARRGLIESVRVRSDLRGQRIGSNLIGWCLDLCRQQGCSVAQLTTNKSRVAAHAFYERLGFEQTHFGYKLSL